MARLPSPTDLKRLEKCPYTGKYVYPTEAEAIAGKKQYRKLVGPRLHPYKCKAKDPRLQEHYHLGHNRSYKRRQQIKSMKGAMVKA